MPANQTKMIMNNKYNKSRGLRGRHLARLWREAAHVCNMAATYWSYRYLHNGHDVNNVDIISRGDPVSIADRPIVDYTSWSFHVRSVIETSRSNCWSMHNTSCLQIV